MYPEKESATLELKERLTDSFLKTVSAYANYGDGRVLFGVADDGTVLGVSNPKELRLKIENKINDCISPPPEYTLREKVFEGRLHAIISDSELRRSGAGKCLLSGLTRSLWRHALSA